MRFSTRKFFISLCAISIGISGATQAQEPSQGEEPTQLLEEHHKHSTNDGITKAMEDVGTPVTKDELGLAYDLGYQLAITNQHSTNPELTKEEMEGENEFINRGELAKIISIVATYIGYRKETNQACVNYEDMQDVDIETQVYIYNVCRNGIMGIAPDGSALVNFAPNSLVTRAQSATIISRMVYGNKYDATGDTPWYEGHIQGLKDAGIINNTDPTLIEQKSFIILMAYRVVQLVGPINNNDDNQIACTMDYRPVCGTDGVTYGNACTAGAAKATIAYEGECVSESVSESVSEIHETQPDQGKSTSLESIVEPVYTVK